MKKALTMLLAAVILTVSFTITARAEEQDGAYRSWQGYPTGEEVAWDALLARPAGMATCVIGLAVSLVALPFALASGSQSRSNLYKGLIAEPFEFTFKRPLGVTDYRYTR
jgi:hypothetical protein